MQIKWLQLILPVLIFSTNIEAQTHPEPRIQRITGAKDYNQHSFGYNTKKLCSGPMCFPVGTRVGCPKYSYIDGHTPGTKIQFCHISKIENKYGSTTVTEADNYTMATGFVNTSGTFVKVPEDELFYADMTGRIITFTPSTRTEGREQPPCDTNCGNNLVTDLANTVLGAITPSDLKSKLGNLMTAKVQGNGGFTSACLEFIKKDGSIGPMGSKALQALKKVGWQYFDGGPSSVNVDSVCPNFKKFDKMTKEYFWAWTFTSMAEEESSCNPNGQNPNGTNDIADGLFQMEFSATQRADAGRDKRFCPHTSVDSRNITFQMECTASILKDINSNLPNKDIASKSGYWAEMRGIDIWHYRNKKGKLKKVVPEISWHIMDFPGCGAVKPKSAPPTPVAKR